MINNFDLFFYHGDALSEIVVLFNCGGQLVNLSPEAKRNYTDELLLPFKFGAAVLSQRTGVPIIPYAIAGTYKPFRGRITICFGEPIYPEGRTPEEINRQLYETIAGLLGRIMPPETYRNKHLTAYDAWGYEK